eukprot:evm.model.NODE_26679_length_19160_cov_44.213623.3
MTMTGAAAMDDIGKQQHVLVAEAETLKQEEKGGLFLPHAGEGYERVTLAAVDTSEGLYVHPQGATGIDEQQRGRQLFSSARPPDWLIPRPTSSKHFLSIIVARPRSW